MRVSRPAATVRHLRLSSAADAAAQAIRQHPDAQTAHSVFLELFSDALGESSSSETSSTSSTSSSASSRRRPSPSR
jgi:hypothetical protein